MAEEAQPKHVPPEEEIDVSEFDVVTSTDPGGGWDKVTSNKEKKTVDDMITEELAAGGVRPEDLSKKLSEKEERAMRNIGRKSDAEMVALSAARAEQQKDRERKELEEAQTKPDTSIPKAMAEVQERFTGEKELVADLVMIQKNPDRSRSLTNAFITKAIGMFSAPEDVKYLQALGQGEVEQRLTPAIDTLAADYGRGVAARDMLTHFAAALAPILISVHEEVLAAEAKKAEVKRKMSLPPHLVDPNDEDLINPDSKLGPGARSLVEKNQKK